LKNIRLYMVSLQMFGSEFADRFELEDVNVKRATAKFTSSCILFRIYLFLFCYFFSCMVRADSIPSVDPLPHQNHFNYIATGSLLVGSGVLVHLADHEYSQNQSFFLPHCSSTLDDVGRWVPELARIGLHLAGVESRSDWVRTVNSRMLAYGVNLGVTECLKRMIRQKRPDGSDFKSTPSGHAAMAFMSAEILDEEFGYISPFITLGGYAVSTAIAYNRTRGNHHYAGDVILGSGIGLLAAKAGYLLCDWALKGRGKRVMKSDGQDAVLSRCPSFIGIYGGYGMSLNSLRSRTGFNVNQLGALQVGLEGAYYPFRYFGFGGRMTEGHWLLKQDDQPVSAWIDRLTAVGGLYTSVPVSGKAYIGGELLGGYSTQTGGRRQLCNLGVNTLDGPTLATGVLAGCTFRKNLDLRCQLDYEIVCGRHQTVHYLCPALGLNFFF